MRISTSVFPSPVHLSLCRRHRVAAHHPQLRLSQPWISENGQTEERKKSPRAQSMDGREGSQPVWPQICMFMYVPFHGPLRRHRPDPAVASPSYRIVPSHQSAGQVWFDCIFLIPLEALMLHFAVPTHRRQPAAATPVLSVLFLLEHIQPRSPSRRRRRWREVEGGRGGGGTLHSEMLWTCRRALMRCLVELSRACMAPFAHATATLSLSLVFLLG